MKNYKRGDLVSTDEIALDGNSCDAQIENSGFVAECNLPDDHQGPHVAVGPELGSNTFDLKVVEVWDQ